MKYDVFISYSRKDSEIVKKFADELDKAGYKYWMDIDGIESGDEFKRKIASAIRKSKVFLFFSSATSNESGWTVKEVNYAIKKKIHIIPIKLDSADYNESVDFDLCAVNFIQCNGSESIQYAIDKLLRSLKNRIGVGSSNVLDENEENVIEEKQEETTQMQVKKPESGKTVGLDIEKPAQPDKSPVKWMDFAQFCDYNGYSLKKMSFFPNVKLFGFALAFLYVFGCFKSFIEGESYTWDIMLLVFFTIPLFIMFRMFGLHHSYTICDIQDTSSQFKLIRNKNGSMGISVWSNRHSKRLLPMKYDNIFCINDDTFICTRRGFVSETLYNGVYNATKKKMVVPVKYDSIEYKNGKIYASSRDGVVSVYTDRGYRVVE